MASEHMRARVHGQRNRSGLREKPRQRGGASVHFIAALAALALLAGLTATLVPTLARLRRLLLLLAGFLAAALLLARLLAGLIALLLLVRALVRILVLTHPVYLQRCWLEVARRLSLRHPANEITPRGLHRSFRSRMRELEASMRVPLLTATNSKGLPPWDAMRCFG